MTDFKMMFKGIGAFFGIFFALVLLNYFLPPMLEALESIISAQDLAETVWTMVIFVGAIGMAVVPSIFFYNGLITQYEDQVPNAMLNVIIGILMFLLSILITYRLWDWFKVFADILADASLSSEFAAFTLVLYWLGLIIVWVEYTLVAPFYLITNNLPNPIE